MSTPSDYWGIVWIVITIVVLRQFNIIPDSAIPAILGIKRIGGILQMARDKELTAIARHHHADTTIGRIGNHRQFGIGKDILAVYLRMTAVRHHEHIIEPAEDGQRGV